MAVFQLVGRFGGRRGAALRYGSAAIDGVTGAQAPFAGHRVSHWQPAISEKGIRERRSAAVQVSGLMVLRYGFVFGNVSIA